MPVDEEPHATEAEAFLLSNTPGHARLPSRHVYCPASSLMLPAAHHRSMVSSLRERWARNVLPGPHRPPRVEGGLALVPQACARNAGSHNLASRGHTGVA